MFSYKILYCWEYHQKTETLPIFQFDKRNLNAAGLMLHMVFGLRVLAQATNQSITRTEYNRSHFCYQQSF